MNDLIHAILVILHAVEVAAEYAIGGVAIGAGLVAWGACLAMLVIMPIALIYQFVMLVYVLLRKAINAR